MAWAGCAVTDSACPPAPCPTDSQARRTTHLDCYALSLWTDLGVRDNPYNTTPIPPTAEGARLLVGREVPLRRLSRGIPPPTPYPTVEGDNGVGKTSLVSIAGYTLLRSFKEGQTQQLFITLPEPFQLLPGSNRECPRTCVGMIELERHADEGHAQQD